MTDEQKSRQAFEEWIGASPYYKILGRIPQNEIKYAWPGQYLDINVQTAWEAWQQAIVWKKPK